MLLFQLHQDAVLVNRDSAEDVEYFGFDGFVLESQPLPQSRAAVCYVSLPLCLLWGVLLEWFWCRGLWADPLPQAFPLICDGSGKNAWPSLFASCFLALSAVLAQSVPTQVQGCATAPLRLIIFCSTLLNRCFSDARVSQVFLC